MERQMQTCTMIFLLTHWLVCVGWSVVGRIAIVPLQIWRLFCSLCEYNFYSPQASNIIIKCAKHTTKCFWTKRSCAPEWCIFCFTVGTFVNNNFFSLCDQKCNKNVTVWAIYFAFLAIIFVCTSFNFCCRFLVIVERRCYNLWTHTFIWNVTWTWIELLLINLKNFCGSSACKCDRLAILTVSTFARI